MNKYTLCICYPTYNRGELFIQDIRELLTNNDSRFYVSIQDNCSDDGSYEKLISINDPRLSVRKNGNNIGGIANTCQAISNISNADYILFCLDKDKVNPDFISDFIDFIEEEHPYSGFVDLYFSKRKKKVEKYTAGKNAIINTAYLSKHPSGFFWKREELEYYIKKIDQSLMNTFPFVLDLIQAEFALRYDSYIVYMPVITHAPYRKEYMKNRAKTLSYNKDNVYFSFFKRIEEFKIYHTHLNNLICSTYLYYHLFLNLLYKVTIVLKESYKDEGNCWHYNLQPRIVTLREMLGNIHKSNMFFLLNDLSQPSMIVRIGIILFASIRVLLSIIVQSCR